MKVPEVEVQNLSSALLCIRKHLPVELICEEVTISMDAHNASWSALCIATDAFPTPKNSKNCIPVKRLLQMNFKKYGVVRRVQISIHNQPNGDVSYKWHVLINPRHPKPKMNLEDTLKYYFESTLDQIHENLEASVI